MWRLIESTKIKNQQNAVQFFLDMFPGSCWVVFLDFFLWKKIGFTGLNCWNWQLGWVWWVFRKPQFGALHEQEPKPEVSRKVTSNRAGTICGPKLVPFSTFVSTNFYNKSIAIYITIHQNPLTWSLRSSRFINIHQHSLNPINPTLPPQFNFTTFKPSFTTVKSDESLGFTQRRLQQEQWQFFEICRYHLGTWQDMTPLVWPTPWWVF